MNQRNKANGLWNRKFYFMQMLLYPKSVWTFPTRRNRTGWVQRNRAGTKSSTLELMILHSKRMQFAFIEVNILKYYGRFSSKIEMVLRCIDCIEFCWEKCWDFEGCWGFSSTCLLFWRKISLKSSKGVANILAINP